MFQISAFRNHGNLRAALALLFLLALSACGGGAPEEAMAGEGEAMAEEAVPVEVSRVTRRPMAASYSGTAPLEARAEAQVVAKTSGVALQVLVEVGDRVRAGQVLARLDSARAALQAQQTAAQLHKLENEFRRAQQLVEQQLISRANYDQIRFDLENARAVNRLAQLELSYANVRAPISGVVAQASIKPGNFVQINTPIFTVVDTDKLEATLNVPERELATLEAGLDVQLRVDALPGKTFTGVIDRISPVVDAGSGTFRVVSAFDSGGVLQPGMFGRISIDYDRRADALVVPRAALLSGEGDAAVFVVRDGKAVRVPVELGYMEAQWVEVRSGLELGDRVVVAGKTALREGSLVQVISSEEPARASAQQTATEDAAATEDGDAAEDDAASDAAAQ